MWRSSRRTIVLAGLLALTGCGSHQDAVCQDIGDCAKGGDSVWIAACQAEAKALRGEADSAGCAPAFDAYYACADASYSCQGATPEFPGCDDELATLDACLAGATAGTSCAALAAAETACGGAGPDAGVPPACTAARDCLASCYRTAVANVCAPRVDELEAANVCGASCPP
jgi:hypothetical protein